MVHCSDGFVMYAARYDQLTTMNTYGYSGEQQDQYQTHLGTSDNFNPYQTNYSDPNIQHLAQSASWAGVYAARSGHGNYPHNSTSLLDEWSSPTHQSYCGNSDSSPSPNGYGYSLPYRSNNPTSEGGYVVSSPANSSPVPPSNGNVVSVIASHHSLQSEDPGSCQSGQANVRPLRPPFDWMKRQAYQATPSAGKTRTKDKYRVVYSDHQRLELEKEFHYSRYITIRRKAELAQSLSLSERQVKIWFQNRRAKERKQKKKEDVLAGCKIVAEANFHSPSTALACSIQLDTKPPTSHPEAETPHLSHTSMLHAEVSTSMQHAAHQQEVSTSIQHAAHQQEVSTSMQHAAHQQEVSTSIQHAAHQQEVSTSIQHAAHQQEVSTDSPLEVLGP